ncbi:MAG: DNA-3-methyladenine glycosylase 2 family protein [Chloroflexaceae bacterium]|nr:DNA-3-methyladenine glycosylase 2 family protein [Chloroflexaceae bacterium]
MYQRLQAFYGESGPTAGALLATPTETLRSLGISRTKALYLRDLAEKVVQEFPTLGELAALEDEAIIKQLTQIKGVGCWTAQILLIFRLGRPDVLPVEDLGIRKALQKHYQLTDLPDRQTVARIGAAWQPYRSLACLYLWQSLSPTATER